MWIRCTERTGLRLFLQSHKADSVFTGGEFSLNGITTTATNTAVGGRYWIAHRGIKSIIGYCTGIAQGVKAITNRPLDFFGAVAVDYLGSELFLLATLYELQNTIGEYHLLFGRNSAFKPWHYRRIYRKNIY